MSRYLLLCFLVLLQLNCKQPTKRPNPEPKDHDLTAYVNPFLGTAPLTDPGFIGYNPPEGWRVWAGLTYPGATLPNAMVQLSPITAFGTGAGYEYEAGKIMGFAHTNKGHWNLCNLPVLPISGRVKAPFISSFSHDREKASPDYYEVYLEDYKVEVLSLIHI